MRLDEDTMADLAGDLIEGLIPDGRLDRLERVLDQRLSGLTVLLEDLHHPQNMGACVRTAEAFGLTDVWVVSRHDDPFRPTHKIARGGQKWIDIHRNREINVALDDLERRGFRILATNPDAADALEDIDFSVPTVLCLGNEIDGVSIDVSNRAHGAFRIPMYGLTQSLNVSVALGVCLYEATRRRRAAVGREGDLSPEERETLRGRFLTRAVRTSRKIAEAISKTRSAG
jgi:tRNA (guanosine-2'-O-)-methyltransferase